MSVDLEQLRSMATLTATHWIEIAYQFHMAIPLMVAVPFGATDEEIAEAAREEACSIAIEKWEIYDNKFIHAVFDDYYSD